MESIENSYPVEEQVSGHFNARDAQELAEKDMSFFGGLCLPEVCDVSFPPEYVGMWMMVVTALGKFRDFSKFALGLPRGHGKTTVVKLLIVFIILFTRRKFVLVVSASSGLAENIIADVEDILDSQNIINLFGNWREHQTVDRQEKKVFHFRGRHIILAGLGSGTSLRGLNVKNARPDVIIGDDMQSQADAESESVSKKLLQWFVGTLMKAKSPRGCTFLYVGNMYRDIKIGGTTSNIYTCILRNLQLNPTWVSWIVGGILSDGTALWEEVQPLEQLLEELKSDTLMGCADVFYAEVLNDPKCGSTQYFDLSKMPAYDIDENFDVEVGRFMIIDPSLGKKKSDAQIVLEGSVYNGQPVITDIHIKQVTAPKLVEFCIQLAISKRIPLICPEYVAYQGSLGDWFHTKLKEKQIEGIQIMPVTPKGRRKNSRIIELFKALMNGSVKVKPSVLPLVLSQISTFDVLKENNVDDILDTCAYVTDVVKEYPEQMTLLDIFDLHTSEYTKELEEIAVF